MSWFKGSSPRISGPPSAVRAPVPEREKSLNEQQRDAPVERDSPSEPLSVARTMHAAGITVRPVRRVAVDSAGVAGVVRDSGEPVLFEGLADRWPARRSWNPDELKRRYTHRTVTALLDLPVSGVLFPQEQERYEKEITIGEFVDRMYGKGAEGPCYLAYKRTRDILDPAECDFESLLPEFRSEGDTRVWIGSAGTRSMLHSDLKDNLFCQLWGEKDVVLLPWQYSRAAYPFPDNLVNSMVDVSLPDVRRFPRLRGVPFRYARMRPGDVLFIPRGCWHDIRSITPSVSVNHWYGASQRTTEYLRLLALLGPRYWKRTALDFVNHGVLRRTQKKYFFFSPDSTGKRLHDALRFGDFSRENDPVRTEGGPGDA